MSCTAEVHRGDLLLLLFSPLLQAVKWWVPREKRTLDHGDSSLRWRCMLAPAAYRMLMHSRVLLTPLCPPAHRSSQAPAVAPAPRGTGAGARPQHRDQVDGQVGGKLGTSGCTWLGGGILSHCTFCSHQILPVSCRPAGEGLPQPAVLG